MNPPYRGWFWRFAPLFRWLFGSRQGTRSAVLDSNRVFELKYFEEYWMCLELALAIDAGSETIQFDKQSGSLIRFDDTGNEVRPLLADDPWFDRLAMQSVPDAIELVALFDEAAPRSGRFEFVIKDHRLEILVERNEASSASSLTLRLAGASRAKEQARALIEEMVNSGKEHHSTLDGPPHRIWHGSLPLRERLGPWIELVFGFSTLVVVMGLCCYLYGTSSMRRSLGVLGWIPTVLLGLLLGLKFTSGLYWLIGPQHNDWLRDDWKEESTPDAGTE